MNKIKCLGQTVMRDLCIDACQMELRPHHSGAMVRHGPEAHASADPQGGQGGGATGYEGGGQVDYTADYKAGDKAGDKAGQNAGIAARKQECHVAASEAALDSARAEGYQAGIEAAAQRATQRARQQDEILRAALSERVQRLDQLLVGLNQAVSERLAAVEDELIELVFAVTCRVIGDAAIDQQGIASMVRQALAQFPSRTLQSICVSARDHALLSADSAWKAAFADSPFAALSLVPDERVVCGGCIIVAAEGSLDARLDCQLQQFRELLLKVHQCRGPAPLAVPQVHGSERTQSWAEVS